MDNQLLHYGTKRHSGRYPWGSGDRPFQSSGGSSSSKKKNTLSSFVSDAVSTAKSTFMKSESERKAKQENRTQLSTEEAAKRKADLLKRGSASDILKYKDQLTYQEMNEAYNRLQLEQKLSQMSAAEKAALKTKVDNAINSMKTVNNAVMTGADSYNLIASVYNTTPAGKKNPLPLVNKNVNQNQNQNQNKNNQQNNNQRANSTNGNR